MAGDDVVNYATKLHEALECEGEADSRVEVATARVAAGSLTVTKAQLGSALLTARLRGPALVDARFDRVSGTPNVQWGISWDI
jgi:hypothetical protein